MERVGSNGMRRTMGNGGQRIKGGGYGGGGSKG